MSPELPKHPLRIVRRVARRLVDLHVNHEPPSPLLAELREALRELGADPVIHDLDEVLARSPIDRLAIYSIAYDLVHELPSHEPLFDELLYLLGDRNAEQRALLEQLESEWLERLLCMDLEDRTDAAAALRRRIKSPKLKTRLEAFLARLLS